MKTIKELIEKTYNFLKSNYKEHPGITSIGEMAPQLFEFLDEKGTTDSVAIGVHAGFLHASAWYEYRIENENLTNQKELDHIKTQYDIKCDEKRKSDNEIARLIKIIMDAGLTEKLEVDYNYELKLKERDKLIKELIDTFDLFDEVPLPFKIVNKMESVVKKAREVLKEIGVTHE